MTTPTPTPENELALYGLSAGQEVRFRWKTGGKWRSGRVMGTNTDGSLQIHDDDRGYSRAMSPGLLSNIQYKTNGPRGGTRWVTVEELRR